MRRPDTPEQRIPTPVRPDIDHDLIDWPREVHAPLDADRMCLAVARAQRFHLLRVAGSADAVTPYLRDAIIGQAAWYPRQGRDGWWMIGHVSDVHDGTFVRLRILWHPETDRVKVSRPPAEREPAPAASQQNVPISHDHNFLPRVAEGWRYWYKGVLHTPEQARAVLAASYNPSLTGWTWERIEQ